MYIRKININLNNNPTKAISEAYFECVTGIKKSVEMHLIQVAGRKNDHIKKLFDKNSEGFSLYDLRSKIAHGRHDVLSDEDMVLIGRNVDITII